jgi:DNA replicative helicase MCM subunit Mcm2 (Cdc46/Mcm family)
MRLQELAEDVPMGHIPRSLTAVVKGELCRGVSPGDIIEMSGIFLPKPYTGFKVRATCCGRACCAGSWQRRSEVCMR